MWNGWMNSWLNVVSVIICNHVHFHVLYFSFKVRQTSFFWLDFLCCWCFVRCSFTVTHDPKWKKFLSSFHSFLLLRSQQRERENEKEKLLHELICVEKWLEFLKCAMCIHVHTRTYRLSLHFKLLTFTKWFIWMKWILCISYFVQSSYDIFIFKSSKSSFIRYFI